MNLVIDYLRGTRRGQRQIVSATARVTFGRHPESTVVFDAMGDVDASARHAELIHEAGIYTLRDVGSSNGTWLEGLSVESRVLPVEETCEVEFGNGGPVLRLWLGDDPTQAPRVPGRRGWRRFLPW